MKIFISWSGETAKEMARLLKQHIMLVFQTVSVWYSEEDIAAGEKGLSVIEQQLSSCEFGIICVTPSNQLSPWLNFEAGALSKNFQSSRVMPVIFGMGYKDMISGPLKQFQAKEMSEEGIQSVLLSINSSLSTPRPESQVAMLHRSLWQNVAQSLSNIEMGGDDLQRRSVEDKLDEVLSRYVYNQEDQEHVLLESSRMSRQTLEMVRLLVDERLADPSQAATLWLKTLSLQSRAFVKPAKISILNAEKQIILKFDARGAFHARQVAKKANELEGSFSDLMGTRYRLVIISQDVTLWPVQPKDEGAMVSGEFVQEPDWEEAEPPPWG